MARKEEPLRLGKSAAFLKSRLKRLRQLDDAWQVDFRALPKPPYDYPTSYRGMVVAQRDGSLLAESDVAGRPSVNDLASLLAHAMRRPLNGSAHRPKRILLHGHPQWRELFPHLAEIGIAVGVRQDLAKINAAYSAYVRHLREIRSRGKVQATAEQAKVAELFPAVAKYVEGYGHIEIGDQEMFGFIVRALDYGGMVFEDDKPCTLAEALAALEQGLRKWFKEEQGVELD